MRTGCVRPTFLVCAVVCTAFLFSPFANRASLSTQSDRRLSRDKETAGEKRIALVIGNGAYAKGPLKNPPNDARAMAATLREVGFETLEVVDADKVKIQRALRDFGTKLRAAGGVGLFYYAGHGVQVGGHNYLVPIGAEGEVEKESDVEIFCIDAEAALRQMEDAGARVNIVILDACRNNPFSRSFSRGGSGGLAEINAPSGTLIAYATDPGKTASDGEGSNGLYTQELLAKMRQPGLRIEDVFNLAGAEVERKSGKQQQPWISSKLRGAFYFKPPVGNPGSSQTDPAAAEREAWEAVRNSAEAEDFRDYLKSFPDGPNATTARVKLRQLEAARPKDAEGKASGGESRPASEAIRKSEEFLLKNSLNRVNPEYPGIAKTSSIQGEVIVEFLIDENGNVISARGISGHALLLNNAVSAARRWTFKPVFLEGKPVKVTGTLTFQFVLGQTPTVKSIE